MKKRILSMLMAVIMVTTLLPTTALAEGGHTNHCICGASHAAVGDHTVKDEKTFDAISNYADLVEAAANDGYYYLANDIELNSTINVTGNLNLCLNGHSIRPVDANTCGRAFSVSSAVTFNLTNCTGSGTITGFKTTDIDGGAGVLLKNDAKFNMYGGSISGNTSSGSGGGVAIYDSSVEVGLYGGSITGNRCGNYGLGGGLYGRDNMNTYVKIAGNPQVLGNTKADGTTASNCSWVKFEIVGPLANTAKLSFYSDFGDNSIISVGKYATGVTGNYESCFVHDSWNPSSYVCEKDDNGNISMFQFSEITFDANGGTGTMTSQKVPLRQNTALKLNTFTPPSGKVFSYWSYYENGGGPDRFQDGGTINRFYADPLTLYAIWGNPTYEINKATTENGSFAVPATATASATVTIMPTPDPGYEVDTITVNKTASGDPVAVNNNKFTMPAEAVTVKVTFRLSHEHKLCQTANCTFDHNGDADGLGHDAVHFVPVSTQAELHAAATNGGSVYLANDIAITSTINVTGNLNLCLNGHSITPADSFTNGKAITVNSGATFVLTDCGGDGSISGFTNDGYGAGVHANNGCFIMYGGKISNNQSTYMGGGVLNQECFIMYGGTICGNQAQEGGGVYNWGDGYIYGGTIENNTATENGGGLHHYYYADSLLLSGNPTICGNKVNGVDNNVYLDIALTIDENFAPTTDIGITMAEFGRFAEAADGANIPDISVYAEKFTSEGNYPIYTQENALYIGYYITEEPGSENDYTVGVNSTDGVSYQWLELKEGDIPVTDQSFGNGGMAHGTYDSQSGCWSPYVLYEFSGYFAIPMNADETLTVVFTAEPDEEPFLFGQGSGEYADVTKDGNTYVFTAPESDTYMLLVPEENQPTLKATKYGVGYLPVDGLTDAKFTGTKSGTYVCKVTWDMGTPNDPSDDYTLTSAPVEYTAAAPAPAPGGYDSTYPVVENKGEDPDGTVKLSSNYSTPGSTVTVAVTPDKYYSVDKVIVRDASGNEIETTKNADGTYSFKMPSGKVTVEAVYVWENPFVDVKEDTYYIDAVEWALKNGVTEGTSETTFSPVAACTRAEMVTFLWRAAGCPEPKTNLSSFTDIDADSYYAKAVLWALENGITSGTSKTAFSPDMECSRAQMAAFLCRMADGKAKSDVNAFADVKPDAYYADSVQWAVENGVTSGTGAGKYSPDATCTRGQMVTFLYRYYA